jgi:hypothetical protein
MSLALVDRGLDLIVVGRRWWRRLDGRVLRTGSLCGRFPGSVRRRRIGPVKLQEQR